jgi:hypothetical protein
MAGRWSWLHRSPARLTNFSLLVALSLALATGIGAVATGSPRGRWVVIGHGVAAVLVVLLVPWKTRVARAGLRHRRVTRWLSLALAVLTVVVLLVGFGYATGVVQSVAGLPGLWVHVAVALALIPLAVWHVVARRARVRSTDLSRRTLLRSAALLGAAGGLYAAVDVAVRLTGLPGARRRFTGSYETGSFAPDDMPVTIWLLDPVPVVNAASWRLSIVDGSGAYSLKLGELTGLVRRRALLDCTSGWYAEQDWTGVPVRSLLRSIGPARSLMVHSVTGYWLRLPLTDLDGLLLATGVGDAPLSYGHGYPLRLVAPGRRGYWWVKWVDRIELQSAPWWWQPPFPVT